MARPTNIALDASAAELDTNWKTITADEAAIREAADDAVLAEVEKTADNIANYVSKLDSDLLKTDTKFTKRTTELDDAIYDEGKAREAADKKLEQLIASTAEDLACTSENDIAEALDEAKAYTAAEINTLKATIANERTLDNTKFTAVDTLIAKNATDISELDETLDLLAEEVANNNEAALDAVNDLQTYVDNADEEIKADLAAKYADLVAKVDATNTNTETAKQSIVADIDNSVKEFANGWNNKANDIANDVSNVLALVNDNKAASDTAFAAVNTSLFDIFYPSTPEEHPENHNFTDVYDAINSLENDITSVRQDLTQDLTILDENFDDFSSYIDGKCSNLATDISNNSANLSAVYNAINVVLEEHEESISQLDTDLAELSALASEIANNVSNNTIDIGTINTEVSTNLGLTNAAYDQANSAYDAANANAESIRNNADDIANNTSDINRLTLKVNEYINGYVGTYDAINVAVDRNEYETKTLVDVVTDIRNSVSELDVRISENTTNIAYDSSNISTLNSTVRLAYNQANSAYDAANANASDIANNTTDIEEIETVIDDLKVDLGKLSTVTNTVAGIAVNTTNVATLANSIINAVNAVKSKVDELDAKVTALEGVIFQTE